MLPNDGPAVFYDGLIARQRRVALTLGDTGLIIVENDAVVARWAYESLRRQDAPSATLRLSAVGAAELARIEIADDGLAAEILRRCPAIPHSQHVSRAGRLQIIGWSMAAAISLVLTAIYLVPLAADRVAPLVPHALERRLGDAVDNQVRALLGTTCDTPAGGAALRTLRAALAAGTDRDLAVEMRVLSSPVANAFALPGGRIYLLNGLLALAADGDEVAGVLAHEMAHVAHRDGLRRLLQSSASSFLIGLLFGDVVGGGTIITLGQVLVNSAYSREQESAADAFAADLLRGIGRSPKPLGTLLERLEKTAPGGLQNLRLLRDHPMSTERMAALATAEPAMPGAALLSEQEWRALKTICATAPVGAEP